MGAPQAVAAIENILEEIAGYLGLDPLDVRRKNCDRGPGRDVTQQGQSVFNDTLSVILDRLAETAGYARRREEAVRFNAGSRTHVRGLTLMPVRCGVPRGRRTRHQGSAWVDIDRDGTIQVSIGGPDMGHEFRTMFRHLVADQFAVPIEMVRLTLTAVVHYNSAPPSSALAGIDVDGTAALRACEAVKDRLTELAAKHLAAPADGIPPSPGHVRFENAGVIDVRRPGQRLGFLELVQLAHAARVDLGARGFYATSAIDLGRETASIYPYASVTSGAALSEAEIDRASGQLSVKQVDILIDIGRSLSPAVDRDQVIGGFLHGMRWATTSKHLDSRAGELPSAAASNDETPRAESLPGKTHVDFLEQPQNGMSLESSRSMGESPFLLGISVWAAAKQALTSLSQGRHSALDLPATTEEILRCLAPVIPPEPPAPGEVRGQCDG
jgi:xanthine dehydrogenase large subunit